MSSYHASVVQQSFNRCTNSDGFYDDSYEVFLQSSDEVRELFANTTRAKQIVCARNGLSTILLYALGNATSENLLEDLIGKHGPQGLDVPPELYSNWVEALVSAVKIHDPEFSPQLEEAWRAAVQVGVNRFLPCA